MRVPFLSGIDIPPERQPKLPHKLPPKRWGVSQPDEIFGTNHSPPWSRRTVCIHSIMRPDRLQGAGGHVSDLWGFGREASLTLAEKQVSKRLTRTVRMTRMYLYMVYIQKNSPDVAVQPQLSYRWIERMLKKFQFVSLI